ASGGGMPRALIGVPIAVVLLVGGAVSLLRPGASTTAQPVPSTTSAAAPAAGSAGPAGAGPTYDLGPLTRRRGADRTVTTYQLGMLLQPPKDSIKWTLDAPCGALSPLTASAQVSWSYDNNTKTCDPGRSGPFPGKVTVTYTAQDGKTYSWSAGSDTG